MTARTSSPTLQHLTSGTDNALRRGTGATLLQWRCVRSENTKRPVLLPSPLLPQRGDEGSAVSMSAGGRFARASIPCQPRFNVSSRFRISESRPGVVRRPVPRPYVPVRNPPSPATRAMRLDGTRPATFVPLTGCRPKNGAQTSQEAPASPGRRMAALRRLAALSGTAQADWRAPRASTGESAATATSSATGRGSRRTPPAPALAAAQCGQRSSRSSFS